MTTVGNLPIDEIVADAQRLLQYASVKGLELNPDLVSQIVNAQSLIGKDVADPATFEAQEKFWRALGALSSATMPATTNSVRHAAASTPDFFRSWLAKLIGEKFIQVSFSTADFAVRGARRWALLSLMLVAFMQAYYEVGSTTVTNYEAAHKLVNEKREYIERSSADVSEAIKAGRTAADLSSVRKAISDAQVEMEQAETQTERQIDWARTMLFGISWDDASPYEAAQSLLSLLQGMLIILRDFLLPMGWGFLGAALYVSRTLADDIKTVAYAPERAILHRSRYFMGMIAGFVVAKFFPTDPGITSAGVTPLALALLVGYSVEVLFALLDKLIATFSQK